jgi:2-aminoadipate transaminase
MSEPVIRFTRGVPPPETFPKERLAECACAVLEKYGDVVLQYGPSAGFTPLRQWIAAESSVEEGRTIIGQGSLHLQDMLARLLLQPGDTAYVEEPTYDRTVTILRRSGAYVVGFPLSAEGPDVEEMERRLKDGERPKLLYVIPDFQNPSGMVIPLATRQRIADLAREYDFWIIEDSPYRRLRYAGDDVPAIFDLCPERTIRMSSFSKLISPGLRVGYAVLPVPLAKPLLKYAEDSYINPSYFNQAIVHEYIQRGYLDEALPFLKSLYAPRLQAALNALDREMDGLADWVRPQGGFFVSVMLKAAVDADSLLDAAGKAGLILSDGRGFYVERDGSRFIRLPFCALTTEEIEQGIRRLAQVVRELTTETVRR